MRLTREQIIANALADAINTLNQIGASYTITDASGAVFTNIVASKKRNDFSALNITNRLLDSSIGDEIFFESPAGIDPGELQSALGGHANKIFGSENYNTRLDRANNGVVVTCGKKRGPDLAAVFA